MVATVNIYVLVKEIRKSKGKKKLTRGSRAVASQAPVVAVVAVIRVITVVVIRSQSVKKN